MPNKMWNNNRVQFMRMLAEIRVVGLSRAQVQYLTSADGMDVTEAELNELMERAEVEWQDHKKQYHS